MGASQAGTSGRLGPAAFTRAQPDKASKPKQRTGLAFLELLLCPAGALPTAAGHYPKPIYLLMYKTIFIFILCQQRPAVARRHGALPKAAGL
jgi:hypothetical protein